MQARLLPLLILPLAVLLLQYHSVMFWTSAVTGGWGGWEWALLAAPWNGWGWSGLLELGNLWAWLRTREGGAGWWAVASLTTALLCAGALWNVAAPARADAQVAAAIAAERERVAAQELRTDARATARAGWYGALERDKARGAALFGEWIMLARAGAVRGDGERWALLAMQLLAVLLAQGLAVAAIRQLGAATCALTLTDGDGRAETVLRRAPPSNGKRAESGTETWAGAAGAGAPSATESVDPPRESGAESQPVGAESATESDAARRVLEARFERVLAVRRKLAATFPGLSPGEIARQAAPVLYVAMNRLCSFERDRDRYRAGERGIKIIGPAELERLERLAETGHGEPRGPAPRPE